MTLYFLSGVFHNLAPLNGALLRYCALLCQPEPSSAAASGCPVEAEGVISETGPPGVTGAGSRESADTPGPISSTSNGSYFKYVTILLSIWLKGMRRF